MLCGGAVVNKHAVFFILFCYFSLTACWVANKSRWMLVSRTSCSPPHKDVIHSCNPTYVTPAKVLHRLPEPPGDALQAHPVVQAKWPQQLEGMCPTWPGNGSEKSLVGRPSAGDGPHGYSGMISSARSHLPLITELFVNPIFVLFNCYYYTNY